MCLIAKVERPKIADRDIVCYKVVNYSRIKQTYTTICMDTELPRRILKGETPFYPIVSRCYEDYLNNFVYTRERSDLKMDLDAPHEGIIASGWIHTFAKRIDASKLYKDLKNHRIRIRVYKCIIPKGTEYYAGRSDDSEKFPEFASQKIIFKRRLLFNIF